MNEAENFSQVVLAVNQLEILMWRVSDYSPVDKASLNVLLLSTPFL